MKQYILIIKNVMDEILLYRINFVMWRFRNVVSILIWYFLWTTIIPKESSFLGYSHSMIATYVLGTNIVYAITASTKTDSVGSDIVEGNLSNLLIRPYKIFLYYFSKEIGDKVMNFFFSCAELILLFFILKPSFFFQQDGRYLFLFAIGILCAVVINFLIGFLLGMIGFLNSEIWAPRYLYWTILSFFSGTTIPLDVFPKPIFSMLELLPFSYIVYFPMKIYLGQLDFFLIGKGFVIAFCWVVILCVAVDYLWKKGLYLYGAEGR